MYNIIVTGLCIGFAGGFAYFVYLWFKGKGKKVVVDTLGRVHNKVDGFVDDMQSKARGERR